MVKSFSEIRERVAGKEAVVMTAEEISRLVESGDSSRLNEVDVVTTATRAVMSGTYAVLSFPVAEPGSFFRARRAWINGIEVQVGPCPNENLGILDLMVFGTAHSRSRPHYGGGHLFRDLVEGKKTMVEVETDSGRAIQAEVTLDQMPFARLFGSRHAFKNYSAFVNAGRDPVATIFHRLPFAPLCAEATFSGCGLINPIQNDPHLESIGLGSRILLNGAEGYVIGTGTRSSKQRPNLSGFADMHLMNPEWMGGFITSAGPECICSWAVAIPVISESILAETGRPDRDIPLPVNDVCSRTAIGVADYGDVWTGVDLAVDFEQERCISCPSCRVEEACPMRALSHEVRQPARDQSLCFHCGLCVSLCPGGVFRSRLGEVKLKMPSGALRRIPVTLRQSDRLRAVRLAEDLKRRILDGSFNIVQPVGRIS
ncbi:MAG: putative methanosis marker 16 metalloprotein [Methanomicrobia archaeon]|nr:putative methanosis marker 16 metalloprotein [Methanomicrobia archaeon]